MKFKNFKQRIMYRAIQIRLKRGENLLDILESYPKLTPEFIEQVTQEYKSKQETAKQEAATKE